VFLENSICSVFFFPLEADSVSLACFKFGARSVGDSSTFTHIPSIVGTCASLYGFDVVFSQQSSSQIHCLPLGDYDGTADFVPALSFTRMPGTFAPSTCSFSSICIMSCPEGRKTKPYRLQEKSANWPVFQQLNCLQLQTQPGRWLCLAHPMLHGLIISLTAVGG
jgi:hypothetical protein